MGKKLIIVILLLLIFVFAGSSFYYVYQRIKAPRTESEETPRTESEEQIQYYDDCEQALLDTGRDYVICSMDSDDRLYLTNDKRVFSPGEYLGFQINLQKLNEYFDPYYMCLHSNFPNYDKAIPSFIDDGFKGCGPLYSQEDCHRVRFSGYVADLPGEYTLAEIHLFPEVNFSSDEEFFDNLDKGKLVLNMTGEIK